VISYTVSLCTREVGIRMALGAEQRDVLSPVLRQGLGLVAAGIAVGICCSVALTRFLAVLLYEVRPTDWPHRPSPRSAWRRWPCSPPISRHAALPIDPMAKLRMG
jgi:ABC-type antimicrobial peptide transport system permease subunit